MALGDDLLCAWLYILIISLFLLYFILHTALHAGIFWDVSCCGAACQPTALGLLLICCSTRGGAMYCRISFCGFFTPKTRIRRCSHWHWPFGVADRCSGYLEYGSLRGLKIGPNRFCLLLLILHITTTGADCFRSGSFRATHG